MTDMQRTLQRMMYYFLFIFSSICSVPIPLPERFKTTDDVTLRCLSMISKILVLPHESSLFSGFEGRFPQLDHFPRLSVGRSVVGREI